VSFFFERTRQKDQYGPTGAAGPPAPVAWTPGYKQSDVYRISHDWTISPTFLNRFYAGGNNCPQNHGSSATYSGGPCTPPAAHLLSVGGVCGVRGRCQRECESCPTGAGGGDPLIEAVREARIEIRLEGHGAAADKPGAVLLLRAEEVFHALLICAVGDRQAGGLQSHQRAAGGECRSKRLHPDMLFSPFAAGVAGSIRSCQKSRPRSSKRMRSMLSTWWA